MPSYKFTLTSYDPVYAVCPEVRIPDARIRETALRWLQINAAKDGEEAKLTDQWVRAHVDKLNSVDDLLIFIKYNMYRENREIQQLADQDVICAELAKRLVEDLPEELVEESVYAANYRLNDMLSRNGLTDEDYCKQRGITLEQLYADIKQRALQSLKEDSALAAYADYQNYTLDADDFYAIIPGDSIDEKARKRTQMELEGRLAGMEEYALKTKALKEVMENAMIKRSEYDEKWLRYGDTSAEVLAASEMFPDAFVGF